MSREHPEKGGGWGGGGGGGGIGEGAGAGGGRGGGGGSQGALRILFISSENLTQNAYSVARTRASF